MMNEQEQIVANEARYEAFLDKKTAYDKVNPSQSDKRISYLANELAELMFDNITSSREDEANEIRCNFRIIKHEPTSTF